MATEILPLGTSTTSSSDIVIASGDTLTLCLKDEVGPIVGQGAHVDIQIKDDVGQYFTVASLSEAKPFMVLSAPGTYRLTRTGGASCGVFSSATPPAPQAKLPKAPFIINKPPGKKRHT